MKKKKYIIYLSQKNAFFIKNTVDMIQLSNKLHVTHEFEKAKKYSSMENAVTVAKQYVGMLPQIMTIEEELVLTPVGLSDVIT